MYELNISLSQHWFVQQQINTNRIVNCDRLIASDVQSYNDHVCSELLKCCRKSTGHHSMINCLFMKLI